MDDIVVADFVSHRLSAEAMAQVALKLLRSDLDPAAGLGLQQRRERFTREAKAMARLAHANVVTVHDAGTIDNHAFIAMEFVEGSTLPAWLKESPRTWREIIDAFAQAGTGLAAAHRAGTVHRDFKPDNVLVGEDGRVQMGDFGLVSIAGDRETVETLRVVDASVPASLTQTGTLLGTIRYMGPEQHSGKEVDARSDQFAFCVALYEGLYSEFPFAGETYKDIRENVLAGAVQGVPEESDVPAWVHAVVMRGLSTAADDRYASMEELLEDLANDPSVARKRRLVIGGVSVVFVALAALAVTGLLGAAGEPNP